MQIRLNKFISDSGMCSRREADRIIEVGKVTINGRRATTGCKVNPGDKVRVNGNLLDYQADSVYIALNKPVGIVCTTDPTEPDNIIKFVNFPMRIFNIGRLDKQSEGLILLTNDGNIVNKILRAENNHDKLYEVVVNKPITDQFVRKMSGGVSILGVNTKKCKVEPTGTFSFNITLTQGLNRQIRRMCEALDYEVVRLKRTRIMNVELGGLPVGHWRLLEDNEVEVLQNAVKDSDTTAPVGVRSKNTRKRIFHPSPKGTATRGTTSRSTATRGATTRSTGPTSRKPTPKKATPKKATSKKYTPKKQR